ncbi:hypothetical protein HY441_00670 [Candidatus Microgenomates bacterium]|nr:hypothetical protein [Candidatus Microgenomates bacterium]
MAAVAQWSSNKSGDVPSGDSEVGEVVSKYLNDFNDPSEGVAYVVKAQTGAPSAVGEMSYDDGSQCNATNDGFSDGSGRDYALLTRLEKNGVVVCVDSGG